LAGQSHVLYKSDSLVHTACHVRRIVDMRRCRDRGFSFVARPSSSNGLSFFCACDISLGAK
jgi:hypothetical protein